MSEIKTASVLNASGGNAPASGPVGIGASKVLFDNDSADECVNDIRQSMSANEFSHLDHPPVVTGDESSGEMVVKWKFKDDQYTCLPLVPAMGVVMRSGGGHVIRPLVSVESDKTTWYRLEITKHTLTTRPLWTNGLILCVLLYMLWVAIADLRAYWSIVKSV